jgi:hypothetical protein
MTRQIEKTLENPIIKRRKRCQGGQPTCKNYVGEYKDVEGVGCCEHCDKYIDDNPYDPYFEHMEIEFADSKEYQELEKAGLTDDYNAYEKAFEKYQENYEPWPTMRRRMASAKK